MLVEEVVLLIAFAVTEIKRLLFIDNLIDSIKVMIEPILRILYWTYFIQIGSSSLVIHLMVQTEQPCLPFPSSSVYILYSNLTLLVQQKQREQGACRLP